MSEPNDTGLPRVGDIILKLYWNRPTILLNVIRLDDLVWMQQLVHLAILFIMQDLIIGTSDVNLN